MRRKNDILWKGMLEEIFDDFLHFVFPEADQVFDWARGFEFLDKELNDLYPAPDEKSITRFVDKLVKVYMQGGKERWLLIHIEVQDQHDPLFAARMFGYYYRIFDRYRKPVTAIAVFTGTDGYRMPDKYEDKFLGTSLVYQYNTLRITDYSDKELSNSDNPFSLVVLAAKKAREINKDPELLQQKIALVKLLYAKEIFKKEKIEAILRFLNNYLLFESADTNLTFTKEIDLITRKTNTMTLAEQIAEMRVEEKERFVVENLLKVSDFPKDKIAAIAGVSVDFVKEIELEIRFNER